MAEHEAIRIQKYLSQAGRASRREAERLMEAGRVTVNGVVVTEMGSRVVPGQDVVAVDGEDVEPATERWIMLHKPPGVLTTRSDPHGGRTVYDLLPEELHGLTYVGRLDLDGEGMLLFTNDGDTAHGLQHPSREVEREYWLEVAGTVGDAAVRALRAGVELDDGPARAKDVLGVRPGDVTSELRIVLTEGRKREVRRMLAEVGHPVMRLRRIRYGPVTLGDLPREAWRDLTDEEVSGLERAAAR